MVEWNMEDTGIHEHAQPVQISKEQYLAKLSESDRENVLKVIELFNEVLKKMEREGALYGVGGVVTKLPPRKDIDLFVVLNRKAGDPVWTGRSEDFPEFLLGNFKVLEEVVHEMVSRDSERFTIESSHKPLQDWEFDHPLIFRHEGKITLVSPQQQTTPIDFIRNSMKDEPEPNKPFVLLTKVSTNPTSIHT